MAFYTFRETLEIIVNCKTQQEITKISDEIMPYKKEYSVNDLKRLKILIQSQYDFLKQKQ